MGMFYGEFLEVHKQGPEQHGPFHNSRIGFCVADQMSSADLDKEVM